MNSEAPLRTDLRNCNVSSVLQAIEKWWGYTRQRLSWYRSFCLVSYKTICLVAPGRVLSRRERPEWNVIEKLAANNFVARLNASEMLEIHRTKSTELREALFKSLYDELLNWVSNTCSLLAIWTVREFINKITNFLLSVLLTKAMLNLQITNFFAKIRLTSNALLFEI